MTQRTTFHAETPLQALLVEQALLLAKQLETTAETDYQNRRTHPIPHDAEFLENGRLLLYDNFGSINKGTRILEYDPQTQAIPWFYANENSTPFSAFFRGMKQRLPNGNILVVDPENRRLFEVTADKELVWENFCPLSDVPPGQHPRSHPVNSARRYRADELTFLKGWRVPVPNSSIVGKVLLALSVLLLGRRTRWPTSARERMSPSSAMP